MQITAEDILLARRGKQFFLEGPDNDSRSERETLHLPDSVVEVLSKTFSYLAQGKDVTVIPRTVNVTTQQAAEILHVSRPFVVKLLESGEIPFHKVGKHRRVLLEDVIAYKEQIDRKRLKTLCKLSEQAQELDLGY